MYAIQYRIAHSISGHWFNCDGEHSTLEYAKNRLAEYMEVEDGEPCIYRIMEYALYRDGTKSDSCRVVTE